MSELTALAAVALTFGVTADEALTVAQEAAKQDGEEAAYREAARLAKNLRDSKPLPAEDEAVLADLRKNAGADAADLVEASLRANR